MAKNQTTTVFCIHCSFKTFPPFIIYVLSESFLQFIFYNTCSLFMQLLCRSILYQSCLICQISFLSCFWKIYFYDIIECLFEFLFYILAFGNQILYNRNIRNLSQSRRLPPLQVVSNSKFVSVGVQSPTEINAPRGCAVILIGTCQLR